MWQYILIATFSSFLCNQTVYFGTGIRAGEKNRNTTQCTTPISVVSQCNLAGAIEAETSTTQCDMKDFPYCLLVSENALCDLYSVGRLMST